MPELPTPAQFEARHERAESGRLDNFVDGAFAFTVTLLVIGGTDLPKTVAALDEALRGIPAFAACFLQLALFWHGHVRWRDSVRLTDTTSLWLSLLLVFFVLIFVFPLHLVYAGFIAHASGGALSPGFRTGPVPLVSITALFVCFGLSLACMAGTLALLYRHGVRAASLERDDAIFARVNLLAWTCCAAVGLLSALVVLALYFGSGDARLVAAFGALTYVLLIPLPFAKQRYRMRLERELLP